jgi:hypothetical protein
MFRRRRRNKLKRQTRARLGRLRHWAKSKKGKRTLLIGGAAAVGLFLLYRAKAPAGAKVALSEQLKPADVTAGQLTTVDSYRVIAAKRDGMAYEPAQGTQGSTMSFTSSVSGKFTRNFFIAGGVPFAEIKAS